MEYKETIIDVITGQITEREFTKKEIEAIQKETLETQIRLDAAQAEAEAKATARQEILDRLGITADEAALLL